MHLSSHPFNVNQMIKRAYTTSNLLCRCMKLYEILDNFIKNWTHIFPLFSIPIYYLYFRFFFVLSFFLFHFLSLSLSIHRCYLSFFSFIHSDVNWRIRFFVVFCFVSAWNIYINSPLKCHILLGLTTCDNSVF